MPVKYISHIPNTVEGQAVLDNFVRTRRVLRYRDNNKVYDRIKRGLPLYEVEKIESVGNNPKNLIMRGECISACAYLKDKGIKVDLVYIDPPFASGADYAKKVYIRRNPKLAEKIAKSEEKLDIEELRAFEEKMYGDIWNKEDYLNWMYENLTAIKSIMSVNGSIYVHLDHHIGHYVKILLDEVFGEDNFQREIIWDFTVLSGFKVIAKNWIRGHDSIFYYSVSEDKVFNKLIQPHTEEYKAMFKPDSNGRLAMTAHGVTRYWDEVEPKGKPFGDVWDDIMSFQQQPTSAEKVDYATQKPETLLERIIKANSNEGMLVADFFGGSGVTAKVANDLKRNFIHVDVGINSVQTTRDRLNEAKAEFDILDVKDGVSLFRNPIQTMNKLKSLITGLRNEDSLDSFWEGAINDSKLGLVPVYVPNLLDHSTKVLDKPMMNRIINEAIPDLPDNTKQVIVFYIDIDDEKELNKFIDEYNNTDVKIVLRDLKEILDEVVINDIVEFNINENEIEFTKFLSDRLMQKINEYNKKKGLNGKNKTILDVIEENGTEENGDDEVDNIDDNGNDEETETEEKTKKKKFVPIEISETGLELIEMISLDCTNKEGIWKSDYEIKIDKNGYLIKNGQKTKEFWDGKISSEKTPLRMKVRNIAGDETEIIISENKSNTEIKVKSKAKKK
ncbi:MAG: site-specific DNA-methyltransferase [Bacteroidota bacterium]